MNKPNSIIRNHVNSHFWYYAVIIFCFILGVSIGAISVNGLSVDVKTELKSYIDGFLNINMSNSVDHADILRQSIKFNLYSVLFLFLAGLTYLGLVFTPLFSIFRGFCIGFTVALLTDSLGNGGFMLSIASVLPQNLIYIPIIMVLCVCSFNMSYIRLRSKYSRNNHFEKSKQLIMPYSLTILFLFVILLTGSLVEAYITSYLIQYLTPYII